jgi:FdhD protein
MPERPGTKTKVRVRRLEHAAFHPRDDAVATEEPLEIRVLYAKKRVWQTVTMRTPGADFELAAGLLFTEGLITSSAAVHRITYCASSEQMYNIVNVTLNTPPILEHLDAFRVASSACGVCGKASLDALSARGSQPISSQVRLEPSVLVSLPDKLRAAQGVFDATGGLHAAGAFTLEGALLAAREDVGRHNALDKLVGWALLNRISLEDTVIVVSGRIGFEIAQKCVAARAPILCAVGAPSSLAVKVAREYGLTMIGFLRGEHGNVYSGAQRLENLTSSRTSP